MKSGFWRGIKKIHLRVSKAEKIKRKTGIAKKEEKKILEPDLCWQNNHNIATIINGYINFYYVLDLYFIEMKLFCKVD